MEEPQDLDLLLTPFCSEALYIISKDNGCLSTFEFLERGDKRLVEYSRLDPTKEWKGTGEKQSLIGTMYRTTYNFQPLIAKATEAGMTGAFSLGYSKPRFFIFPANVPEQFIPFVLLHEVIESDHQGVGESCTYDIAYRMSEEGNEDLAQKFLEEELEFAGKYPHLVACQGEIGNVFKKGEEFARGFSRWLMKYNSDPNNSTTIFNQAIPGFLARNNRFSRDPLSVVIEFYLASLSGGYKASEIEISNYTKEWSWIRPFLPKEPLEDRVK